MQRFQGLIGIALILGLAYLFSNNKKKINFRLVISGVLLQVLIGVLVFKVEFVQNFFRLLGRGMQQLEMFSRQGAAFVYGGIAVQQPNGAVSNYAVGNVLVFAFNITATIVLVCALVAIFYYLGVMQRLVAFIARIMRVVMRVSGAEALSNVASAFVGQVEAQVMIRPYLATMTMSELLASMSGSLACIAGGILIIYSNMGTAAGMNITPNLLTASLMAAPGALVISKIVYPETEESQTMGKVKLKVKSGYKNIIDAVTHGAGDGFKIAMNVIAMIIGFVALIALLNYLLLKAGHIFNPHFDLTLDWIFGKIFYPFAWAMGIPQQDVGGAATLLGQKLTINEFIAFKNLTDKSLSSHVPILTDKGLLIITIAICGFANFSSVGMQIGGIGEIAPERKGDLAKLGMKALFCGTLASYLSATIAGIIM
ncbi:MAG TPA: nucleoside transporter C-terminal domain-containing protein [Chitinophagaceae bacterium]|nr:nucleoside transporter C-terminal domain-containing protein [Chitinophagaceae bacterium]